jgi:hypothetical protein
LIEEVNIGKGTPTVMGELGNTIFHDLDVTFF